MVYVTWGSVPKSYMRWEELRQTREFNGSNLFNSNLVLEQHAHAKQIEEKKET